MQSVRAISLGPIPATIYNSSTVIPEGFEWHVCETKASAVGTCEIFNGIWNNDGRSPYSTTVSRTIWLGQDRTVKEDNITVGNFVGVGMQIVEQEKIETVYQQNALFRTR